MTLLSKILNTLLSARNSTDTDVFEAIEHVVDSIEPNMRYFPGYKKILYDSVATTLAHISNLVDTIPGPLLISRNNYVTDPQVNACFSTVDRIQEVFSNSQELRSFFDAPVNSELDEAYALLCMQVEEKTIAGMELQNDIVRRDVMQTALNFTDYKILSPAVNETEVREGIKQCIFNGLITYALQEIINIKEQKLGLELHLNKLSSKLKTRQLQGGGLSNLLMSATETPASDTIQQEISDNKKELEKLPSSWDAPRYYLESIKNTLSQPENFITLQEITYDVTRMGIVSTGETSEPVNTIHINKILIANVLERAVAIVRYNRSELLPRAEFRL